jgi:hypothetical protein
MPLPPPVQRAACQESLTLNSTAGVARHSQLGSWRREHNAMPRGSRSPPRRSSLLGRSKGPGRDAGALLAGGCGPSLAGPNGRYPDPGRGLGMAESRCWKWVWARSDDSRGPPRGTAGHSSVGSGRDGVVRGGRSSRTGKGRVHWGFTRGSHALHLAVSLRFGMSAERAMVGRSGVDCMGNGDSDPDGLSSMGRLPSSPRGDAADAIRSTPDSFRLLDLARRE